MNTKHVVVYDCSQWKKIEDFCEQPPDSVVSVLLDTFVVEAIQFVGVACFMIASKNRQSISVLNLHAKYEGKALHAVVPSVDVVAKKQEISELELEQPTGGSPHMANSSIRS